MDNPKTLASLGTQETEEAIRNGQSKDTGIIGHPRHRTKRSKTHKNTTQKTKTMNNTYLTKKTGGNQVGNFWLL
jgi:hypothetical protein